MGWPEAIKEISALLRSLWEKGGAAITAFFAGRASVKSENVRDENKAMKKELDHERDEDAIMSDPVAVERMRERFKKPQ